MNIYYVDKVDPNEDDWGISNAMVIFAESDNRAIKIAEEEGHFLRFPLKAELVGKSIDPFLPEGVLCHDMWED